MKNRMGEQIKREIYKLLKFREFCDSAWSILLSASIKTEPETVNLSHGLFIQVLNPFCDPVGIYINLTLVTFN